MILHDQSNGANFRMLFTERRVFSRKGRCALSGGSRLDCSKLKTDVVETTVGGEMSSDAETCVRHAQP